MPLLSKFKLRRRVRRIEYEGIHLICFKCGVYGHREDHCREHMGESDRTEAAEQPAARDNGGDRVAETGKRKEDYKEEPLVIRPEISKAYGPWMLAPWISWRRGQSYKSKGTVEKQQEKANERINIKNGMSDGRKGNTRYDILAEEELIAEIMQTDGDYSRQENGSNNENDKRDNKKAQLQGRGKRPTIQITEKQVSNMNFKEGAGPSAGPSNKLVKSQARKDNQSGNPMVTKAHKGSNKAAAYETHVVVRGNNSNKSVTRDTVGMHDDTSLLSSIPELEMVEHFNDPLYDNERRSDDNVEMISDIVATMGP